MYEDPLNRLEERPRPLADAASTAVKVIGTLSAFVAALAGSGIAVLSAEQADALTALLGATPGLITMVGVALASFGIVKRAEPKVTPVESPRDADGARLVRAA
jgi:uncharacterized protein with von Willebrand factor type A (vWA) domain